MSPTKPPKQKVCKTCKAKFAPARPMAVCCSSMCALSLARSKRGKAEKVAMVKDRRETKAKLAKFKTRGEWLREAKTAIQKFRRLEELAKGRGCMSCGRPQHEVIGGEGWKPGGAWDGGHFMSKGAHPELALEPLNIWLQCKSCNGGSSKYARKGYTVNAAFEAHLIEQEGAELVEWLKGPHEPKHYTIEELIAIKQEYAARVRELKGKA